MITNELGSQYDAENQAIQEARRIQLEAYQQALLGTPPPTQDAEDELTIQDAQSGATYRIPLSQLTTTQTERFEISSFPAATFNPSSDEWETSTTIPTIRFDKSQFTGYRSIVFRAWMAQTNSEITATVYLRLVDSDDVPVAGSEIEHTGTTTGGGDGAVMHESGDISDALVDGPTKYYLSGKVSDVDAYVDMVNNAIVVRFGPEAPDA